MTKYPEYAKIGDKLYKIDTDFKTAIKCQSIAQSNINDGERALAIIYLLFGDEGLDNPQDYKELLQKGIYFLSCGKEVEKNNSQPDMDFEQDEAYIKASFYTDYGIPDIYNTNMHWWEFIDLMNGLKEDCVLNRVREIRTFDTSNIKDTKTLEQIRKQKESVALKRKEPEIEMTEEQKKSYEYFMKQMNLKEG